MLLYSTLPTYLSTCICICICIHVLHAGLLVQESISLILLNR